MLSTCLQDKLYCCTHRWLTNHFAGQIGECLNTTTPGYRQISEKLTGGFERPEHSALWYVFWGFIYLESLLYDWVLTVLHRTHWTHASTHDLQAELCCPSGEPRSGGERKAQPPRFHYDFSVVFKSSRISEWDFLSIKGYLQVMTQIAFIPLIGKSMGKPAAWSNSKTGTLGMTSEQQDYPR